MTIEVKQTKNKIHDAKLSCLGIQPLLLQRIKEQAKAPHQSQTRGNIYFMSRIRSANKHSL